jgi:hypothetical protein
MELAERLGKTLGELDTQMGAWELRLWMAKAEVDNYVHERMDKVKGLSYSQALDMARADHRAVMERKTRKCQQ